MNNQYTERESESIDDEEMFEVAMEEGCGLKREQASSARRPAKTASMTTAVSRKQHTKLQEEETEEFRESCLDHPRLHELYLTADWWSLWIGLSTFGMAMMLTAVFVTVLDDDSLVVPQPEPWTKNPLDSWSVYNLVGIPVLWTAFCGLYLASLFFRDKLTRWQDVQEYTMGFAVLGLLAVLSFWLGRNTTTSKHGLGYAVFAILFGMLIGNIFTIPGWLERVAMDGEFFIKCSLVLLAVDLDRLVAVGGPAMLVAWIGSPLALIAGYLIGVKLMGCEDHLSMIMAVGATWCGASAISAVAPVVQAKPDDVSLAIGVVAFFTIVFTFVQAYIAIYAGIPDAVAGGWIGGSVDQTGNVIVSAAIISEEATEAAGIVKMVLNAGLGLMTVGVALFWNSRKKDEGNTRFQWILLWDKFPKFTIGFLLTSIIMTFTVRALDDKAEATALPRAVSSMNRWWFAIAFVGIGLTTKIRDLLGKALQSGVLQVYMLTNLIDMGLSLGLSYAVYAR